MVVSATQITVLAPLNATAGPITVTTPSGSVTSAQVFTPTQLSIGDASVKEGNPGGAAGAVTFTVTLTGGGGFPVSVSYATADGTANAGSDYLPSSGTLDFAPGETTKTLSVAVIPDTKGEANETFYVVLSNPVNAGLLRGQGVGTEINDDAWHDWFAVDALETPFVGDFNGDGKADIITFTRQNPNAVGDVYVALSDGTKFGENTKWHDWFAITTDETVVIGDYDGDGKDDIGTWLGRTTRQVYVARSLGTGMTPETVWADSIGYDPTDVLLAGDANGDGQRRPDLLREEAGEGVRGAVGGDTVREACGVARVLRGVDVRAAACGGREWGWQVGHRDVRDGLSDGVRGRVRVAVGRDEVRGPGQRSELVDEVARLVRDPADGGGEDRGPERGRAGRLLHVPAFAVRSVLHGAVVGDGDGGERAVAGDGGAGSEGPSVRG